MTDFELRVYNLVVKIPKGYVATYGQIAILLGNKCYSRTVGNALHKNPDKEKIPCHRVVRSDGSVSESYAFGGAEAQKARLISEGVGFLGDKVNLKIYKWNIE